VKGLGLEIITEWLLALTLQESNRKKPMQVPSHTNTNEIRKYMQ
jgi:hypothetical protein